MSTVGPKCGITKMVWLHQFLKLRKNVHGELNSVMEVLYKIGGGLASWDEGEFRAMLGAR